MGRRMWRVFTPVFESSRSANASCGWWACMSLHRSSVSSSVMTCSATEIAGLQMFGMVYHRS